MNDQNIKNLAAAIIMQAVKDYFNAEGVPAKQQAVLKDLRSAYMDFITSGMSPVVADHLEKHPDEIRARIKREELNYA